MSPEQRSPAAGAPVRWGQQRSPVLDRSGVHGGCDVGLVPVGATEQHGPHLPVGTDTMIAEAVCDRTSARTGAVVLPAIPLSASYFHGTDLPGTLCLGPRVLDLVLRSYAEWAATSGLYRLLLVNAHFGNTATLGVATDHLRFFRPDLRVGIVNWWETDPWVSVQVLADGPDIHANLAETAVMLAIAPDLVDLEAAATAGDPDRSSELIFRYTAAAVSSNGVTGQPAGATADLGEQLLDRAVTALARTVEAARAEEPPFPPPAPPAISATTNP